MTSSLPAFWQATSGSLGSASANVLTYPLDVVCTRLQAKPRANSSKNNGSLQEAVEIILRTIRRYGYRGLYAGLGSDTLSTLLSNFLYFYAYTFMRERSQRRAAPSTSGKASTVTLSVAQELSLGYLAGVLSRMVTTPLSLVTVRLQVENEKDAEGEGSGILKTFSEIYKEDGITGFWKGFQSTLILASNPAITLLFFQLYRRVFLRGKDRLQPSPLQAFIGAGFSNSIAVAVLYPLILLKTRLQSSRKSSQPSQNSAVDMFRQVVRNEGYAGLYQGLETQLVKGIVSQGVTFSAKQRIEDAFIAAYRKAAAARVSA